MVRPNDEKPLRTLVVMNWAFFCKRDKHNNILPQWSSVMLRDASNIWPWILAFDFGKSGDYLPAAMNHPHRIGLRGEAYRLGLHNVEVIEVDPIEPLVSIEEIKRGIIRNGGKLDLPENPYDFALHNTQRYVIGDHFTWVDQDDHQLAKITLDKPLNFREIAAERAAKTIW